MALLSDREMEELVAAVSASDGDDLALVDRALVGASDDARLHFLRGSLLAGTGRPIEALASLKKAVALDRDFAIARFQLGFFQLTSGEPADALATWGPLALLPDGHYLRTFVGGLTYLIRDEFDPAIAQLRRGIAANVENPPLNRDMQLIIDRVEQIGTGAPDDAGDSMSATSLLLGHFATGGPH